MNYGDGNIFGTEGAFNLGNWIGYRDPLTGGNFGGSAVLAALLAGSMGPAGGPPPLETQSASMGPAGGPPPPVAETAGADGLSAGTYLQMAQMGLGLLDQNHQPQGPVQLPQIQRGRGAASIPVPQMIPGMMPQFNFMRGRM
jgi:hypothetical protein